MSGFIPVHGHRFHFLQAKETYPANHIQKDSRVTFDITAAPPEDVKFGMKILKTQNIDLFLLDPSGPQEVDVWGTCRSVAVTNEVARAFRKETLPTERWEGFLIPKGKIPPIPFNTRLAVQNFTVTKPDFQEVPMVFTLAGTAGGFGSGHYIIGSSVLVGQ